MSWVLVLRVLQIAVVVGIVATAAGFAALYWTEGETDEWGERIGPPRPVGVVVAALLGAMVWLPMVGLLFAGA